MKNHPVIGTSPNGMWHCSGHVQYKNRREYCDGTYGALTPELPWPGIGTPDHWFVRDGQHC